MKKILFICTMVLLCSVGMNAQQRERGNRGDMEKRMKERTENYIKELKLDEKKAAKFRTIFEEAQVQMQKEMASARESGNTDREAMRAKMTKVNNDRDAKIKKILSSEEYEKYEKLMKKEQENRRPGGQGGQGRPDGQGRPR